MPKSEMHGEQYLGEYPWHPYFDDFRDWYEPDSWHKSPVPVRRTATSYSCSRSGFDYSVDETIGIQMPMPWIIHGLGLHFTGGRNLMFADASGRVMFFDPSTHNQGNAAALIDRDAFLALLDQEGLEAIWVIAGEKSVYGGPGPHGGWGGAHAHTRLYRLKSGVVTEVERFSEIEKPTAEQLKEFNEG